MIAAILKSSILNSAILDSAIFVFPFKLTHTCQDWFPLFAQKNLHSFILTQLDDGSHLEFCWVGFRHNVFFSEIHSKTLSLSSPTQTNSFWLKLIDSHSTWWWQPSWIVTICIQPFCRKKNFTHSFWLNLMMAAILNSAIFDPAILHKKTFTHSFWLNLMMAAILNSAMLDSDTAILDSDTFYLFSDFLKNTLSPLSFWFKLIQSDSNSFILKQLDDGSHLEFCHVGFSHLSFSSQTHLHLPRLVPNICTKNLHLFILTQLDDGSYLEICHHGFSHLAQRKKLHSFILTQLDDGSHLEFCHVGFRYCHLGFRHLIIFSQIYSKTLSLHSDSDSN